MGLLERNVAKCGIDFNLESRTLTTINTRQTLVFSNPISVRGIVKTIRGTKLFNSVNTEDQPTHTICLPYIRNVSISSLVNNSLVVTATTAEDHGIVDGTIGTVSGATPSEFNASNVAITVISPTQFTYNITVEPAVGQGGMPVFSYGLDDVTAEKWVNLKNRRLRVLHVENCCEKDSVYILTCSERGSEVKDANTA